MDYYEHITACNRHFLVTYVYLENEECIQKFSRKIRRKCTIREMWPKMGGLYYNSSGISCVRTLNGSGKAQLSGFSECGNYNSYYIKDALFLERISDCPL